MRTFLECGGPAPLWYKPNGYACTKRSWQNLEFVSTKAAPGRRTPNIDLVAMISKKTFLVQRLGLIKYEHALAIQKETEHQVKLGYKADTLLLLEHPHTLTIGRRGEAGSILLDEHQLERRGVTVFETNRGGKVTYHGLGQLVGYPIINLSPDREDVHRYVRDLEEVLITALADFGIAAFQLEGLTGVHTKEGKIAAIGVHISRWVTTHGFALNVNTDLSYFDFIIACEGEPVTSMERLLGREVKLKEVEDRIVERFGEVFEMKPDGHDAAHWNEVSTTSR